MDNSMQSTNYDTENEPTVPSSSSHVTNDASTSSSSSISDLNINLSQLNLKTNKHIIAGSTMSFSRAENPNDTVVSHTYSKCDAKSFLLRVGPNYSKFKNKAASLDSLYEVVGVDFVRCNGRIDNFASKVEIPSEWSTISVNYPYIPPLFIVNAQFPEDFSTSFFSATKEDGTGWSLVVYFRITQETCEALKNIATASPAIKLFAKYCKEAPDAFISNSNNDNNGRTSFKDLESTNTSTTTTPPALAKKSSFSFSSLRSSPSSNSAIINTENAWIGRFKVLLRCDDIEKFGLPSFITSYNAKPVLIRNTGTLIRGVDYIEMDINIHKFASVPKKALEVLFHRFDQMQISMGFCIESREEDEMPETMLGAVKINLPSHQKAFQWQTNNLP